MNHRDRLRFALLLGCLFGARGGHAAGSSREAALPQTPRFAVYYGAGNQAVLRDYDVVVLDGDIDPAIVRGFDPASLVLGYLSVGEVHSGRAYAAEVREQGILLARNEAWTDAQFVDVRDARWKQRVIENLVPEILARGFGGVFLDTLDSSAYLETSDPQRFAGMADAAVDLVREIRYRFPRLKIMVNRGYELLPRIAPAIDMLLGESVHTTYDAKAKQYVRVTSEAVEWQRDRMYSARRLQPSLQLFSLDYWSPADSQGIARIYAEAEANGFVPYVATIDLSTIVARP